MRPFGCLVTILNTLDPLGKFDGKVDEGFLVGYFVSSKAFGVFNNRTRIVQEALHEPDFEGRQPESEVNVSPSNSAQSKKHDNKTKREAKGKSSVESLTGYRNLSADFEDFSNNIINEVNAAGTLVLAISPTHGKSSCIDTSQYLDDPNMPELEDITYSDDKATQTRSMTWVAKDQGGASLIQMQKVWVLVDCRLEKELLENGIDFKEVFTPVASIEAIRLFLSYASFMGFMVYQMDVKSAFLYGTIKEEVYVCQPLRFEDPYYPNKVYKVVKALYGLHQGPRAWYETLTNYLLENGFQRGKIDQKLFIKRQKGDILLAQIYVDDIIFGLTNKDLCKAFEKLIKDKFQMSSKGKFGLTDEKSASTPIDTKKPLLKDPDEKPLLKDPDGEDIDVHIYRSIIVKQIFRYLKGKPHLGLWYPNDSPFDLIAYSDSDYVGASLDRKSTTGGCQFLRCRLISFQCKKQPVVATSSTEAKYVATASCCAQ
nr:putative ribonuclease H-like domain-containing protein [Tanacetum cinerariifolium]